MYYNIIVDLKQEQQILIKKINSKTILNIFFVFKIDRKRLGF